MKSKLDVKRVDNIFRDCLFRPTEKTDNCVKADGIQTTVGFNPKKIEKHKKEIEEMLKELPDGFMKSKGGGWSFLNLCNDKYNNQWTGLHEIMEHLVQLGIAIGKVKYCMPRELWGMFPGGVPYIVIED